ncbi:MAG TPA: phosphatase PAP2 family protein [Solirubrobacteraceae bacterium]
MPGQTAGADAAPVARSDSDQERRWWILAHPSGSLGGLAHRREHRSGGGRRRLTARPGLALFAAAYLLYDASRWIFAGQLPVAREHAHQIVNLERSLHLAVEESVQRALDWGVASWVLSNVYLAAQLVVLPGALIWLYRRSPAVYRELRNTVIATWLIAVPIFALFPVAPPRLAGVGISDTVSSHSAIALTGRSTLFYNPYAAVPSLHVGLAFAIGIAAAVALRARWARVLALSWGPLVTLSVLATGNHYLFDVAAGLLVTAVGFSAGRLTTRPVQQRRGVRSVRRLIPATRS